jgi:hypothetical protein
MHIPEIFVKFWGLWLLSWFIGMMACFVPFSREHGRRWVLLIVCLVAVSLAGWVACIAVLHPAFRPLSLHTIIAFIPLAVAGFSIMRWSLFTK